MFFEAQKLNYSPAKHKQKQVRVGTLFSFVASNCFVSLYRSEICLSLQHHRYPAIPNARIRKRSTREVQFCLASRCPKPEVTKKLKRERCNGARRIITTAPTIFFLFSYKKSSTLRHECRALKQASNFQIIMYCICFSSHLNWSEQ